MGPLEIRLAMPTPPEFVPEAPAPPGPVEILNDSPGVTENVPYANPPPPPPAPLYRLVPGLPEAPPPPPIHTADTCVTPLGTVKLPPDVNILSKPLSNIVVVPNLQPLNADKDISELEKT